jgi:type II secretory pathway pseudopilin PulG
MKAFTLVETLVTIGIIILSMGALAAFIVMAYRTYGYTWEQARAIDEARRGIETMVKEIREARQGDDGSYPIEKAEDKEFIFYSDIDRDGDTERVRYFLGTAGGSSQTKDCVTFADGGSCSASFSNFLEGNLTSAKVKVSVEGDFGWSREYAEIYGDDVYLGRVCQRGCSDCAGEWQGTTVFDVTSLAQDGSLQVLADATSYVNDFCDWQEANHSMKAQFELSWEEEVAGQEGYFKKGVINPTSPPVSYPADQEEVTILSSFVRNAPPIFEYFDENGNKIAETPARLVDTKTMRIYLVVDVDPDKDPPPFELESSVQLRNLKD